MNTAKSTTNNKPVYTADMKAEKMAARAKKIYESRAAAAEHAKRVANKPVKKSIKLTKVPEMPTPSESESEEEDSDEEDEEMETQTVPAKDGPIGYFVDDEGELRDAIQKSAYKEAEAIVDLYANEEFDYMTTKQHLAQIAEVMGTEFGFEVSSYPPEANKPEEQHFYLGKGTNLKKFNVTPKSAGHKDDNVDLLPLINSMLPTKPKRQLVNPTEKKDEGPKTLGRFEVDDSRVKRVPIEEQVPFPLGFFEEDA